MPNKDKIKSILIYLSITFFIITVVFIYMTFKGKPQAGLIEVGGSSVLFVLFLYALQKIYPQSAGITSIVLSVLLAVIFLLSNYYLQIKEDEKYTLREIVIGNLLTKKLFFNKDVIGNKSDEKKQVNKTRRIDFHQKMTEKSTIESTFEKPEKTVMVNNPVILPHEAYYKDNVNKHKSNDIDFPLFAAIYKLQLKGLEKPQQEVVTVVSERYEGLIDFPTKLPKEIIETVDLPYENYFKNMVPSFDKKDSLNIDQSKLKFEKKLEEEHVVSQISNQINDKLLKP